MLFIIINLYYNLSIFIFFYKKSFNFTPPTRFCFNCYFNFYDILSRYWECYWDYVIIFLRSIDKFLSYVLNSQINCIFGKSSFSFSILLFSFQYFKWSTLVNFLMLQLKASEPRWVNSILNIIGVNSLRFGGLKCEQDYILNLIFFRNMININTKYFILQNNAKGMLAYLIYMCVNLIVGIILIIVILAMASSDFATVAVVFTSCSISVLINTYFIYVVNTYRKMVSFQVK